METPKTGFLTMRIILQKWGLHYFLSHLLIARCDIGVQLSVRSSVRSFVRPSVHNLCQGAYSVAVIAGSMKPCIVITLDTHFKKAP